MSANNPRVWVLEVATFRGSYAIGAMHSYATLCSPDPEPIPVPGEDNKFYDVPGPKYPVNMLLDAEQATKLNEVNAMFGRDHSIDHAAGEPSHQFNSDEEAERFGTFVWTKVCDVPDAVLFSGTGYGIHGPAKVLAGPESIVFELNAIWEKWDKDESVTANDAAELLWDEAFERLGLKDPPGTGGSIIGGAGAPERPRDTPAYVADRDGELVLVNPYECSCSHAEYQHGDGRKTYGPCIECDCRGFEARTIDKPGEDD